MRSESVIFELRFVHIFFFKVRLFFNFPKETSSPLSQTTPPHTSSQAPPHIQPTTKLSLSQIRVYFFFVREECGGEFTFSLLARHAPVHCSAPRRRGTQPEPEFNQTATKTTKQALCWKQACCAWWTGCEAVVSVLCTHTGLRACLHSPNQHQLTKHSAEHTYTQAGTR